jgi:hypothetical protein
MHLPDSITFTGFDDRTDIYDIKSLSRKYPIEWGVLISSTNREARFPSKEAIAELVKARVNMSLHCCGYFANDIISLNVSNFPMESISPFNRIQINKKISDEINNNDIIDIFKITGSDIIIQKDHHNFNLNRFSDHIYNLFDESGGKGKLPANIPAHPGFYSGYAGGINIETVMDYLEKISNPRELDYWIDIESSVRTDGWFDLKKVEAICKLVYKYK